MNTSEILVLILNLAEFIAAAAGLVCWGKFKNNYFKWFVILLVFIFITEMVAKFLKLEGSFRHLSKEVYRYINIPITIISLLLIMGREFMNTKFKSIGIIFSIIYLFTFFLDEIIFSYYFKTFNSLSYQAGIIMVLILSLISIFKLINSDNIINYKHSLHFWIATGLLIYYIPSLPLNAFRNSLFKSNYNLALNFWTACIVLDIIMYIIFVVGLILYNPQIFPTHNIKYNARA